MEINSCTLDFVLQEVARLLRRRYEQVARGAGLTRTQWRALTYLAQNEGINQSGLADLLDVEPISLCRLADRLEVCGLIERHPDPSDRRAWVLRLTPAARSKLTEARKLGDMTHNEALTGVSDLDAVRLLETLQILKTNLSVACDSWVATQKRSSHD